MRREFADPVYTEPDDISVSIGRAREAQALFSGWTTERVDDVVAGVAWRLFREDVARRLSVSAILNSGIGNVEDTLVRHYSRIIGALREMRGAVTAGLVEEAPGKGLKRFAKPVGVIAALTPRTAPVATVGVHSLNALKTRNALIVCPNPAVSDVVRETVLEIRSALAEMGAPQDLVQVTAAPSKAHAMQLVEEADLFVATGGQALVERALRSGTPGFAGGPGSAVIIVDDTADVEAAARDIIAGKSFDHGTSCSSESCILVQRAALPILKQALASFGAYFLDHEETRKLCELAWPDRRRINPAIVGKSAREIALVAGLTPPSGTRALVLSPCPTADAVAGKEKLSPILGLAIFDDFDSGLATASELIAREAPGHSCGIYSRVPNRIDRAARALPVSRLMVNQSTGFGNTGSPRNGVPSSVVLSCGTWGGVTTNDNVTWRHFLNYTLVSAPTEPDEITEAELFGRHWMPAA